MKNKKIFYVFALLFVVAGMSACQKFLSPPLKGVYSQDQLSNKKGINGMLINAYATLDGPAGTFHTGASNWAWGSITAGDAYKGTEPTDGTDITPIMRFELGPGTNSDLYGKWTASYDGVGQANQVIRSLPAITDMTDAEKKQAEAEAKFIRAHHHFEAKKMWKNVPYIDEKEIDGRLVNTTDIWPKIEADFKFAYDNLDELKPYKGSINKWAAACFLAKAYMFEKKFAEAKALFTTIIASGKNAQGVQYALMPNFQDNFRVTKENNAETVFSVQSSYGDGSTTNGNYDNILNYPHGGGSKPGGCCGFFQPSQTFVNSFRTDATGLPIPATYNNDNVTSDEKFLSSENTFVNYTGTVDPRLDFTVGRRGVPYQDWGNHPGRDWIRDVTYGGPYSPKKNTYFKSEEGSTAGKVGWGFSSNALNYTIMRYADVLLMAAEAEIEVGSLVIAQGYINQVRARAGAFAPSNNAPYAVAINDPSVTWANYKVAQYTLPFLNQAAARIAVRFERKIELGMEGHRFFDLVRWGIASEEINAYLTIEAVRRPITLAGTAFIPSKNEYFAIPATAIATSIKDGANTLTQNPGY